MKRISRRLPNHFGTIRFLGEGRKNAYAVHLPVIKDVGTKAESNASDSAGVVDGAGTASDSVAVGAGKSCDPDSSAL